jgi:hypothetical protein
VWTPAAPAAVTEPLQEQALLPAEPDDQLLSDSAHTTGTATATAGAGIGSGIGQHRGYDTHSGRQGYDTHDTHDIPYSEHSHHSEQRSARGSSFGNRSDAAAHDEGNGLVQLLALVELTLLCEQYCCNLLHLQWMSCLGIHTCTACYMQ